ncbi:MAG: tail fiber domain-containing protein [Chitinophagaceae bacterium]|nr:tail fiber domain-containing protein [Chitinophagaceae bacterium]
MTGPGTNANLIVAVGYEAFANCITCHESVAVGWRAGTTLGIGIRNTLLGTTAGTNLSNSTLNTAVGTAALQNTTTGRDNTAIGFLAYLSGNFSNSTAIGYLAGVNASNQIRFGNTSITSITGQVNWNASSDMRLKTHIAADVQGMDLLKRLQPITYQFDRQKLNTLTYGTAMPVAYSGDKVEQKRRTGLSAQQVAAALAITGHQNNLVDMPETEQGLLGLRYELLVMPLIKTIQEQQATLIAVKKLIEDLDTQLKVSEIME